MKINGVPMADRFVTWMTGQDRQRWSLSLLILVLFGALSTLAVVNGSFYDDENFSVQYVSQNGIASLIRLMNEFDVHPPGAYVMNRYLLNLLGGQWDQVKIADGLINSLGLAAFYWIAWPKLPSRARLYLFCLLVSAGTVLLWGTSVRWYAYYNPLFMVTLAILLFSDISRNARSITLCAMAILLFHINYVTFCSVPVLLAVHMTREWRAIQRCKRDLAVLLIAAGVALAVCIPQLIVFLTIHMKQSGSQHGSLANSFLQTGMTLGLGNAVFPLAPLPLVTASAIGIAGLYVLARKPLLDYERFALVALMVGFLTMTLSGLGARPRNSTYLLPLVWLLIGSFLAKLPRAFQIVTATLIGLFQFVGVRNAVFHEGTISGSYNTDFRAVVAQLARWRKGCGGRFTVFNHDVVATYMLQRAGMAQSTPFLQESPTAIQMSGGDCYAVMKTYHEPFGRAVIEKLYKGVETAAVAKISAADISRDDNYIAKGWLRHEPFSPYLVHLDLYRVETAVTLTGWRL